MNASVVMAVLEMFIVSELIVMIKTYSLAGLGCVDERGV